MRILLALAALLLAGGTASADPFTVINYECKEIGASKEGIRCAVRQVKDLGPVLLIRILPKPELAEAIERVEYLVARTTQKFYSLGGKWFYVRSVKPNGQVVQRACSRIKGSMTERCHDWYPAKTNQGVKWP